MSGKIELIQRELQGASEDELAEILALARQKSRPTMSLNFPSSPQFKEDYSESYELIESGGMTPTLSGDVTLDFVPVIEPGSPALGGDAMLAMATKLGADRNQKDREVVLANQSLIPTKYRGKYLIFPKTKWRGRRSHEVCVPVAYWVGGKWVPVLNRLAYDWGENDLLLVPCKK